MAKKDKKKNKDKDKVKVKDLSYIKYYTYMQKVTTPTSVLKIQKKLVVVLATSILTTD